MKPSDVFDKNRDLIRETVLRRKAVNPRVFGSVLHGTDTDSSDLDILVDALPDTTLFDLGGLQVELEERLGVPVQIVLPTELHRFYRARVLAEAQAI